MNPCPTPRRLRRAALVRVGAALAAAALAAAALLALFGERIERWQYPLKYSEYVTYYAEKYGIDPYILYAFIRTESGFDPNAESEADARGLMQITEVTFEWIKSNIAPTEALTFDDMYDPETSIRFGCYFVSYCLLRYENDLATAAAAYHNGWGTVDELLKQSRYSADGKTLDAYPYPKMRTYVRRVTQSYAKYRALYAEE